MRLKKEVIVAVPPDAKPTPVPVVVGLLVAALVTVSFVFVMALMGTIAWVSHDFDDDWVFEFSCKKHEPR